MNRIMKRKTAGVVAALLAGSMVVAMTGCGSSSETAGTQQAAGDQKASEDSRRCTFPYGRNASKCGMATGMGAGLLEK